MKPCPYCNAAIDEHAEKCWRCGQSMILPAAVVTGENGEKLKKCPFCAELIQYEAQVCRYCGKSLLAVKAESMGCAWGLFSFMFPLIGIIAGAIYSGKPETKKKGNDMVAVSGFSIFLYLVFIFIYALSS